MSHSPRQAKEALGGPGYLISGFKLLSEPSIRPFAIVPLVINVVLIIGLFVGGSMGMSNLLDSWLAGLPAWLEWLKTLLWLILAIGLLLLLCFSFTLLANLIAAPFNGWLAARVEAHLTGVEPESGLSMMQEAAQSIRGELGKLWFFLSRAALLGILSLILFWIPIVNAVLPVLWFGFGAYMLALEYMDHPMANHGLAFKDKRQLLAEHRTLSLSFGATATLLTALPLVNLIIMPVAVAGATQAWVEKLRPAKPNNPSTL